ncbi:related to ribosomal protein YmL40, mitochondrial [Ramularia collo-cygni]|uniref:Related to ribosomal protein YmL40, mitochondrial n=1 Tax=Ramularia collo-cygni TaxID=112498 RepID=A0A2D3VJV0_9PEZI|nr:related to ribosomal protein YmL40, mitochondrial [Ramularia collo-cygni]CZT24711.1 related to ribosomal protein YmL40, mitochondrial [Ramularia collo-cygni]
MEKVIRRAERASRYVSKVKAREKALEEWGAAWERRQNQERVRRDESRRMMQARLNRQEDWQRGALAPRRDVGEQATRYGSVSVYNIQMTELDPKLRPTFIGYKPGDRVVITHGRDKGRIGVVGDVDYDKGGVQVKDLNMIDVHIPNWMKEQNGEARDVFTVAQMIPHDHVKLVYPLPDPETGIYRDVIIERVVSVSDHKGGPARRMIPGTNTIIPWPVSAEEDWPDNESDTMRISVEEQTFRPTLIRAPMPMSVIDELRGKYSKFRTRHDYDYRARKEAEAAATEGRKGLIRTMRTPLQELAESRAQQKAAEAKELTNEQLAKIGEVIAQEQERTDTFAKALAQEQSQSQ